MKLDDALSQIAEIRQQMARSQLFRGYRSVTTAFSAFMAIAAAIAQHFVLGEESIDQFLKSLWLWLAAAAISLLVVGTEILIRYRRSNSPLQREMTTAAVEQFVPCLVAGALMTYAIVEWTSQAIHLLPGIWCTLFGLGVMASRRVLPRGTFLVGAWYLLAGMLCIATWRQVSFSMQMAAAFGGGQLLAALVLYWTLERVDVRA
jgi:hypothetical protein